MTLINKIRRIYEMPSAEVLAAQQYESAKRNYLAALDGVDQAQAVLLRWETTMNRLKSYLKDAHKESLDD